MGSTNIGGVRIRHHTRRNQLVVIPLLDKPIRGARGHCGHCVRLRGVEEHHPCKVIHVWVDSDGAAIVSHPVWASIQKTTRAGGFSLANAVKAPPAQGFTPATVVHKIDGVDLGGDLQRAAGGEPTVTLDDYLALAGSLGVDENTAMSALRRAIMQQEYNLPVPAGNDMKRGQ